MPGLDGFGLCIAVRREPGLATTPVVLISANYVQEEDRVLAKKAGATAYLERKATLHELIDVLRDLLARGPQPVEIPRPEAIAALHLDRIRGQLDRQTRLNVALARRTAFDVATLAILDRTARIIAQAHGVQNALPQLLQGFVETGDLTLVVLYLADGPDLRFQAAAGPTFIQAGTLPSGELCAEMLAAAPDGETVLLPGSTADVLRIREFLEATGVAHAILCPIHLWGERLGVLLLGSESRDLSGSGWRAFSRTVSTQLALALGLARAAIRTTP